MSKINGSRNGNWNIIKTVTLSAKRRSFGSSNASCFVDFKTNVVYILEVLKFCCQSPLIFHGQQCICVPAKMEFKRNERSERKRTKNLAKGNGQVECCFSSVKLEWSKKQNRFTAIVVVRIGTSAKFSLFFINLLQLSLWTALVYHFTYPFVLLHVGLCPKKCWMSCFLSAMIR